MAVRTDGMGRQKVIGDWVLGAQLGRGSFAVVWQAVHRVTGATVAVKEICTNLLNEKLKQSLECEVSILKRVEHRNIVRLLETLEERHRMYLVMEYCAGGDLAHFIRRCKRVPEAGAHGLMVQLAAGLREMWSHNLVHRDLKPQNLLLSDNTNGAVLKIADFGFARNLQPQGLAETLCGSPLYMAPEILHFHKYDAKADLWSVGAILYELLIGRPPFTGDNHVQLLHNIERQSARIPADVATQLSSPVRRLLAALLKRNPVERLSFEEFFSHPWLTGGIPQAGPHPAPSAELGVQRSAGSASSSRAPAGSSNASMAMAEDMLPFMLEAEEGGASNEGSRAMPAVNAGHAARSHKTTNLMSSSRLDALIGPMTPSTTDSLAHMAIGSRGSSGATSRRAAAAASSTAAADTMDEDDYVIIDGSSVSARAAAAAAMQHPPPSPNSLAALRRRGLAAMWHPLMPSPPQQSPTPPSPRVKPPRQKPPISPRSGCQQPATPPAAAARQKPSLERSSGGSCSVYRLPDAPHSHAEVLEQVAGALETLAGMATRQARPARALSLRLLSLQLLQLASVEQAGPSLPSQQQPTSPSAAQPIAASNCTSPSTASTATQARLLVSTDSSGRQSHARHAAASPATPAAGCKPVAKRLAAQLQAVSAHAQRDAAAMSRFGSAEGCSGDLPDAWEAAYEGGLELSQAGAAEEMLGNWAAAARAYAKVGKQLGRPRVRCMQSAAVIQFIGGEASGLPLQPPLELEAGQLVRVQRYAAAINARLTAAAAHLTPAAAPQAH